MWVNKFTPPTCDLIDLKFQLTDINLCPVLPVRNALDNERMVAADGLYINLVTDLSYTSGVY